MPACPPSQYTVLEEPYRAIFIVECTLDKVCTLYSVQAVYKELVQLNRTILHPHFVFSRPKNPSFRNPSLPLLTKIISNSMKQFISC